MICYPFLQCYLKTGADVSVLKMSFFCGHPIWHQPCKSNSLYNLIPHNVKIMNNMQQGLGFWLLYLLSYPITEHHWLTIWPTKQAILQFVIFSVNSHCSYLHYTLMYLYHRYKMITVTHRDTLLVWPRFAVKFTYNTDSPLLSDKSGFICPDYFLIIPMMIQYSFFFLKPKTVMLATTKIY